jgi:hypothetical protein
MAGKRKRVQTGAGKQKKPNANPDSNQEYNFFVAQDGGGENQQDRDAADQRVKAKRKYARSKGTAFFFSK